MNQREICVLGAGIQGVSAALALVDRGHRVTLIDKAPDCLLRTSLRNEGKLHLGFTYANDPSFRTARLMLESALSFSPLLEKWLKVPIDWGKLRSRPFTYLIMDESIVSTDILTKHYTKVETAFQEMGGSKRDYAGTRPRHLWKQIERPSYTSPELVMAAIETTEIAINLFQFRKLLAAAIESSDSIELKYGHCVEELSKGPNGFIVSGRSAIAEKWCLRTDAVINCTWEERLSFDAQMQLLPPENWVHRFKYRVMARLPEELSNLPSLTMVLGPFGDIVPMGDHSYLSWYPACRQGWSTEILPPREWDEACLGVVKDDIFHSLPQDVIHALSHIVPGIEKSEVTGVDAGVILSLGSTDIDQNDSQLHERSDIGVRGKDGYYSIDTGKFVCGPLFANQLAELL